MKTMYKGKASFLGNESLVIICEDRATLKMRLKAAFAALVNEFGDGVVQVIDCNYGEIEIIWNARKGGKNKLCREVGSYSYGNWTFTLTEFDTMGALK